MKTQYVHTLGDFNEWYGTKLMYLYMYIICFITLINKGIFCLFLILFYFEFICFGISKISEKNKCFHDRNKTYFKLKFRAKIREINCNLLNSN